MGVDITGWVEKKGRQRLGSYPPDWIGVINVSGIVGRNYNMFALLFDVRNRNNVPTPFAHRGVPDDLSEQTRATLLEEVEDESIEHAKAQTLNASWLTWREVQSLDWDAATQEDEARVLVDWNESGADPNYEYTDWEDHPTRKGFEIVLRRRIHDLMLSGKPFIGSISRDTSMILALVCFLARREQYSSYGDRRGVISNGTAGICCSS